MVVVKFAKIFASKAMSTGLATIFCIQMKMPNLQEPSEFWSSILGV